MENLLKIKLQKELENNDIVIYQDGKWTNVRKDEFLHNYFMKIKFCEDKVEELEKQVNDLLIKVKELRGED